jgi:hypothetical protein
MMATNKARKLQEWKDATQQAREGLILWGTYLNTWADTPPSDKEFMAVVNLMSQFGLLEWLDANWAGIDALREALTDV